MSEWSVVIEKAIRDDGSLFFPERLTHEFLQRARRTMGSMLFANQYQNTVIPDEERRFKSEWLKYGTQDFIGPTSHFAFIDPAIGQKGHHDYTGIAVVQVNTDGNWYLKLAARYRLTPTEIVEKMFSLHREFNLVALGVEIVAYQEALLYMFDQEAKRRQKIVPVKGIKRSSASKETRILGLVPRFEWGRIMIAPGMRDFEDEYTSFPRGAHDDILDALCSLEELVHYPQRETKKPLEQPHSPHHVDFERWAREKMIREQGMERE